MPIRLEPLAPLDAIAALEARGRRLDPSFHWQDLYAQDHGRAFTVAKSAGFDILGDIYAGLEQALKEGKTVRQFADELTPLLQAKGWWGRQALQDPQTGLPTTVQLGSPRRLRLIFDVNMRVSYAAGHWASFERNKASRPFLRYVAIMDEATRPTHALHHNLVLPIDHPHWAVWSPPCGWNCRCTLQSLSQADVDRLRPMLQFEPPTIETQPWTNKVTGEVRHIPEGIDPGWDYNPGKAGWRAVLDTPDRLIDAPAELSAALAADPRWLGAGFDRAFAEWFDATSVRRRASRQLLTVGALQPETLEALKQREIYPLSSAIVLRQQTSFHLVRPAKEASIPIDLLRRLPALLRTPSAVLREIRRDSLQRRGRQGEVLIYVFEVPGDSRLAKLAVQIDYVTKGLTADRERVGVVANSVLSGGLVSRADLSNAGFYELVSGML